MLDGVMGNFLQLKRDNNEIIFLPAVPEWWCAGSCLHSPPPQYSLDRHQPSTPACWQGPAWCRGGRRSYCPPTWCGSGHPCHSAPPWGSVRSLWRTPSYRKKWEETKTPLLSVHDFSKWSTRGAQGAPKMQIGLQSTVFKAICSPVSYCRFNM